MKFTDYKYEHMDIEALQAQLKAICTKLQNAASYDDFNDLIQRASHDDYVFLVYGIKMAEYGFFDLSDTLINKLDTNNFTASYIKDIKKYYYPSAMVSQKDLIYLADAYSNIMYNNMAIETTSELLNSTQAADSDYKNYLISLGY